MLNIHDYISADNLEAKLSELMDRLHIEGPVESGMLEALSYFKFFHGEYFERIEDKIISMLGLYYKNISSDDLYSYMYFSLITQSGVGFSGILPDGSNVITTKSNILKFLSISQLVTVIYMISWAAFV